MSWLNPTKLIEGIGGGFFKVNDRRRLQLPENASDWNDVEHPKVSNVCSDQYRIQKLRSQFYYDEDRDKGLLTAIQLVYINVDDPADMVTAPICGVKDPDTPWSRELELESGEDLIGMRSKHTPHFIHAAVKTSKNKVHDICFDIYGSRPIWTLPRGFRIYGFHGVFDGNSIVFMAPLYKARDFKKWDQELYKELPVELKVAFRTLILVKHRHRKAPPESTKLCDYVTGASVQVVWDKIINGMLHDYYYNANPDDFFQDLALFYN